MKTPQKISCLAAALCSIGASDVLAQTSTNYAGNTAGSFGGPIGNGMLTFSTDGTTLTGTVKVNLTNGAFNDELVIYIDDKAGGFTGTSTFTDTGGGDDLREAVSGYNGTARATVNFASGFGADYAIALSPAKADFGSLYTLDNVTNFTYGSNGSNGSVNLTPTFSNNGTSGNGIFTFTLPLSLIGSPSSFKFETTYLNGPGVYRSNEAIGNTITDTSNAAGNPTAANGSASSSLVTDTGLLGAPSTFAVPEPRGWIANLFGCAAVAFLILKRKRQRSNS